MPEVNHVDFRYDPIPGDLYLDHFRVMFHTERLEHVRTALQTVCFDYEIVREMSGTITFWDDERTPEIDFDNPDLPRVKLPSHRR